MSCKVVWNSGVVHLELSQFYGFNISHQCDCDQVHYGLRVYFLNYKLGVVIICTILGWLRGPNKIKCVWALLQGSMPIEIHLTPQEGLHGGRPSLVPDERKEITEEASGSGVASGPHTLLHLFNNIYWMPSMHQWLFEWLWIKRKCSDSVELMFQWGAAKLKEKNDSVWHDIEFSAENGLQVDQCICYQFYLRSHVIFLASFGGWKCWETTV